MDRVFRCYLDSFFIFFINDILLYLKNECDQMIHLSVVLQVHKENQLVSKYSKCDFWLRSVAFLGHVISSDAVEVDPKKNRGYEKLA